MINLTKPFLVVLGIALLAALGPAPIAAQTYFEDPATLHIGGGAGTGCATGCAGDPNVIGSGNTVDVYQNGAGQRTLGQPLLLILAVPNDTTNLFGSDPISGVSFINSYPGGSTVAGTSAFATTGTYGLKAPVSGGFFGTMGSGKEVYSFLTLNQPADNSNSFTNFIAADLADAGVTVNDKTGKYGIYVFALGGGNLGANGLVNITFDSGALPTGTIVAAYGEAAVGHKTFIFDNPFTEAGLTTGGGSPPPTPEPASMFLMSTGLVAFGGMLRRRKSEKSIVP
jgi:hypothetical protein